jgi:O-antigen ligase
MTVSFYSIFLHLIFFSLPLIATFKGKGTVVLVVLLGLLSLKDFWANRTEVTKKILASLKEPLGKWALAFILWCFASSFWSDDSLRSFVNVSRYGLLALIGFYLYTTITTLNDEKKEIFFKAFSRGYIFYCIFFFVEIYVFPLGSFLYTDSSHFGSTLFIKGIVNLGLLFWPFLFFTSQRYLKIKFSKILFLTTAIAMIIFLRASPDAARVGILVGVFGAWIVYHKPKIIYIFSTIFVLFSISSPWLFKSHVSPTALGESFHCLPTSYQHRLFIWNEMSKKALEHPIIGHGFDYATTLSKGPIMCLKKIYFSWSLNPLSFSFSPLKDLGCEYIFSSHPHSGIVQLWIELGLVGIILVLGIFWSVVVKLVQIQNPRERAAYFGLLLFYQVIALTSAGFWQKWVGATIILALLSMHVVKNHAKIPS